MIQRKDLGPRWRMKLAAGFMRQFPALASLRRAAAFLRLPMMQNVIRMPS
jgi:hypothetical protein